MKAETRKELKTNALLASLQGFWRGLKDGTRSSTVYVVGLLALLVVGVLAGWWIYGSINTESRSKLWLAVDDVANLKGIPPEDRLSQPAQVKWVVGNIEKIAKDNPGTMAARTVRFQEARLLFFHGMEKLGTVLSPLPDPNAREQLEQAAKLYSDLARESADYPALQQEGLLGAAKAHEGLGDLDQAVKYYKQLADAKPESGQTKQAKDFLAALEDPEKGPKIKEFYALLASKLKKSDPSKFSESSSQ